MALTMLSLGGFGWLGFLTFVGLLVLACLYTSAVRSIPGELVAAGIAYSISTFAVGLASLNDTFLYLESDSAQYDAIARQIAETVAWIDQLNPGEYGYVIEIGSQFGGEIAQFGFYKLLGILYTAAKWVAVDPVPLVFSMINVPAYTMLGVVLYRILALSTASASVQRFLWFFAMLNPWLLDVVVQIRKDLVIAMFFVGGLQFVSKRRPLMAAVCIVALGTLRIPQALLLISIVLVVWALRRKLLSKLLLSRTWLVAAAVVGTLGIIYLVPESQIAPELIEVFRSERELVDTGGASRYFEQHAFGAVVYALAFPFPPLSIAADFNAIWRGCYVWATYGLLFAAFIGALYAQKQCNQFLVAVTWGMLFMYLGLSLATVGSFKALGFVIIEPRFKIAWQILLCLLAGYYFSNRRINDGVSKPHCQLQALRGRAGASRNEAMRHRG